MNSAAPAPPRAPAPPDPTRAARRLAELSPRAFRTLLLGMAAVAAALAAEGVQTLAEMRQRHFGIMARQQGISPVPYGTALPALHALAPASAGPRVLVRADSAGARGAALCALAARPSGDADLRWVALSADVPPCLTQGIGGRMLRPGTAGRAEMGRARWIVLDADGRARYSRPGIPSPAHLRRTAALLAPLPAAEASR